MSIQKTGRCILACLPISLLALSANAASNWHFVVKNKTESTIIKLEVSQNKHTWGNFDIGEGIEPGERATMEWDSSTDGEKCHQWIRAKFDDGTWSEPVKEDFCHDLDDPIEFTE
ncbi:MAG TPA: hypothetical protein VFN13_02135 [Rudaea sp.]|nr:hypothetical protein [Rudaea sp.]